MTVYDAQPIEKLYSDGFSIGNLTRGIMKSYGPTRKLDNWYQYILS